MLSLKDLPDKLSAPKKPGVVKWFGMVLAIVVFGLFSAKLFLSESAVWTVLYVSIGLIVFALAFLLIWLRLYEGRSDYVLAWNYSVDQERERIIEWGSKAFWVAGFSYVSAQANNNIYASLQTGERSLGSMFFSERNASMTLACMEPYVQTLDVEEYKDRLCVFLKKISHAFDWQLLSCLEQSVALKIKHNNVLADDQVLEIFLDACTRTFEFEEIVFDSTDNFSWVNTCLDKGVKAVLSLEVNLLHSESLDFSGESVSLVLLASPHVSCRAGLVPYGVVHRPLVIDESFYSEDLICFFDLGDTPVYCIKHICDTSSVMLSEYLPLVSIVDEIDICLAIGRLDAAAFNTMVIAACEGVETDGLPRLLVSGQGALNCVLGVCGSRREL